MKSTCAEGHGLGAEESEMSFSALEAGLGLLHAWGCSGSCSGSACSMQCVLCARPCHSKRDLICAHRRGAVSVGTEGVPQHENIPECFPSLFRACGVSPWRAITTKRNTRLPYSVWVLTLSFCSSQCITLRRAKANMMCFFAVYNFSLWTHSYFYSWGCSKV